jgi:glucosamine kinase
VPRKGVIKLVRGKAVASENGRSGGVVVGVDGGGSGTRALCVAADGEVLGHGEAGGANPQHNADAIANVRAAIRGALAAAACEPGRVVALVAGLAGLNDPPDHVWAEQSTALEGLQCPRVHCNDSAVAHAGALRSRPGIIVISGTGSTILAVTEAGEHVLNDNFWHYAGAARHLAFAAVHRLLAGAAGPGDEPFVSAVLAAWRLPDLAALRAHVARTPERDEEQEKRAYNQLAPVITDAATAGSPLARLLCDRAAEEIATGVKIMGPLIAAPTVPVALIGGLARSAYVAGRVAELLARPGERRYQLQEPELTPVAGAALLALERAGVPIDDAVVASIAASPHARLASA